MGSRSRQRSGQRPDPPARADAVLWAIGKVHPNTGWLPDSLLDEAGFVDVGPTLQTRARPEVFAIGDVAASDSLRSTARNRADGLLFFAADGRTIQIPAWVIHRVLLPWVVRRGFYRGVRRA